MRNKTFSIIITLLFILVACGLAFTQLIKGKFYYTLSNNNRIRLIQEEAKRGLILDRNGKILADSEISFDVAVIPQEVKNIELVFSNLSKILNRDKENLLRIFKKERQAAFVPVVVVRNVSKQEVLELEENKSSLPGVIVQTNALRFYPKGTTFAHILGYVGKIDRSRITKLKDYGYNIRDIVGLSGIEEYYDRFLRGEDGGVQVEIDNRGRQIRILGMRLPRNGKDVRLTIDERLQEIVTSSLWGKKGAVIFMDPNNGEILALASEPSFDPNWFNTNDPRVSYLFKDSNSPLLNRAISGLYPPGSVFKVITSFTGLESKKASLNTEFFCPGKFNLGDREFSCWSTHSSENLTDAITHSCNIYFYRLGLILGPDLLTRFAKEFGFGSSTGIDLPYEVKGLVPSRLQKKLTKNQAWYNGDTVNLSIGQGDILISPIQALKMMALVVTNGNLPTPHLLKSIDNKDIEVKKNHQVLNIKQETLNIIRAALMRVVDDETGTAHILSMGNLSVAGKTGTAQVERGKSHAWFVGFCPFKNPRMVFVVFLEHVGSSQIACQLAKEILERMLQDNLL